MKKKINLYQPSCYPKREKATFSHFILLLLLCVSVPFLSYFIVMNKSESLNKELLTHKEVVAQRQQQLSELVIELQKNRAPAEKVRLHETLQNEIKAKQRLLSNLAGIDIKEWINFSGLMRGLSYADMPDLSITHFSMIEGVVNIQGNAKHSDSVPLWLSNMQVTSELSSLAFKALSIQEEQEFFTFQLSNSDVKGKTK